MTTDRRQFLSTGLSLSAGALAGVGLARRLDTNSPATGQADGDSLTPDQLSVNGLVSPVGVDADGLFFAWRLASGRRGARQRAYRLRVAPADSPGRAWQSPVVETGRQAFVAYDGPALATLTRYRWHVAVGDEHGAWRTSPSATFVTAPGPADWRAQWLAPGVPIDGPEEHTYARSEQPLASGTVAWAVAFVAAAHRFELWVNGQVAGSGPSFCYPDEQYLQAVDVTSLLRPGRTNVFGFLHHWYGPGKGRPTSASGLLCQVVARYTDGRVASVVSDGTWRSQPGPWLPAPERNPEAADFVELIDGRLEPVGWTEPGFDDRGWSHPRVLGPAGTAPFTTLYPLRTHITETVIEPLTVRRLADGAVVADFGQVYAARPQVTFADGQPGRNLPMLAGYLLDADGHVSSLHGTQETDLAFGYVQRPGPQSFQPFTYVGFRYFEIDGLDPEEPLPRLVIRARHAAMPEPQAAALATDNPTVDAVWDLGARSALYCSQEQFIDTPTREKGQYVWDGCNESQVVARVFGEQNLTWQALRDFARSQARFWPDGRVNALYPNSDGARDFPTFTALYPEWLYRYSLATGDLATVVAHYPVALRAAQYLTAHIDPGTGLVTGLLESSDGDPLYGLDLSVVVDTSVNILTVNALRRMALFAPLVGAPDDAGAFSQAADALAGAVNRRLTRPDGVYVDGLDASGAPSPHASQQVNVQALAYQLVPAGQVAAVGAYVAGLGMSVSPDHGLELLRALAAAGRVHDVATRVTDRRSAGWARILAQGGTFTWEEWFPSDIIGDSMSHGWGSSVLVGIDEALVGLTPLPFLAAGSGPRWSLHPPTGGLERAATAVPTVSGTLSIAWRRTRRRWAVEVTIPANADVIVTLDGTRAKDITEGGRILGTDDGVQVTAPTASSVSLEVGAGHYEFVAPRAT